MRGLIFPPDLRRCGENSCTLTGIQVFGLHTLLPCQGDSVRVVVSGISRPAGGSARARPRRGDLRLRDGQSPGGTVEVASAEFSAPDGALVEVPLPEGLRIPSGISLSAGRPNPFGGSTRLVLQMEQAGEAEVTVHDLSGRKVATLVDGRLPAGQRNLAGRGSDDHGRALRDGIYFVRGTGLGELILLRQP